MMFTFKNVNSPTLEHHLT